jgi:hypothetical protein
MYDTNIKIILYKNIELSWIFIFLLNIIYYENFY